MFSNLRLNRIGSIWKWYNRAYGQNDRTNFLTLYSISQKFTKHETKPNPQSPYEDEINLPFVQWRWHPYSCRNSFIKSFQNFQRYIFIKLKWINSFSNVTYMSATFFHLITPPKLVLQYIPFAPILLVRCRFEIENHELTFNGKCHIMFSILYGTSVSWIKPQFDGGWGLTVN